MEKEQFVFNARRGSLEKDQESFYCEPFFSAALRDGETLTKDEDFVILDDVAVSRIQVKLPGSSWNELVDWVANQIREFKKEETVTEESKRSACEILEYISRFRQDK